MQQRSSTSNLKRFVSKNWYKLGVIAFLLYIFFQKNLSFEINLNNPLQIEQKSPNSDSPQQIPVRKEREKYTEAEKNTSIASINSGATDRFDISIFSSGETKVSALSILSKVDENTKMKYLKRFAHVAVSERKKFGVPASVILANALLHSYSGTRDLAKSGNNHFAVPCNSDWTGPQGNYGSQCLRHYKNAWSGFRNHSEFVTTGKFKPLRQLGSKDYKSWAVGLEKLGYSNEPSLGNTLVQIIEQYRLNELDDK